LFFLPSFFSFLLSLLSAEQDFARSFTQIRPFSFSTFNLHKMMFIATLLATAVPAVLAAVHDVQVGGPGGLVYDPPAIAAQPGDQVVFHFHPKAHSVTQSSFASPCGPKEGGADSGLIAVPANQTDQFPTWTFNVSNTDPTWFYCKNGAGTAAGHCGQGMVFAINCGPDGAQNSFTNFRESALKIGASLAASASASPSAGGYEYPAPSSAPSPSPAPSGSSNPAPAAAGTEHKVIVGGPGKLAFDPERVTAQPGDTILFEFHSKNHTATQSAFTAPCIKKDGALDSGFIPVADSATEFPTWKVVVNDTAPLWFFCAQGTHCSAGGMVFAVNSDESTGSVKTFAAFKQAAMSGTGSAAANAPAAQPSNGAITTHASRVVAGLFAVAFTALLL